ncbi:MAG: MMPL family transporter [Gammaproteobacteria bacterium]
MKVYLFSSYQKLVSVWAWHVLIGIAILTLMAAWFALETELDASAESLVLENDESLNYYREIRETYGTDDFLVVTYAPYDELLSEDSLQGLRSLRDQFKALESVEKVNSILDAPVIYNANVSLSELGSELETLDSGGVDKEVAMQEFMSNPFYQELLVSKDGNTTALQIIFKFDDKQNALLQKRQELYDIQENIGLDKIEKNELERINSEIKQHNSEVLQSRTRDIATVRKIMEGERHLAATFLGGLPMIVVDIIEYIRSDLIVFGAGVFAFLIIVLAVFFHHPRWVLLPLFCCSVTAIVMFGLMGFLGWQITVISSNFMSILLIITLSLTVHLIVRFRDLQIESPELPHYQLTLETVRSMAKPCFYTILTTIVAFASLVVSNIRPVIDFGWIMILGLSVAFVISFLLFPAALSLMASVSAPSSRDFTRKFTSWLSSLVHQSPRIIIASFLVTSFIVGAGMMQLKVENRFIDNFKSETEIYQGMIVIDKELGGTTPLDIILDPDEEYLDFNQSDDYDDELEFMFPGHVHEAASYWLNPAMMDVLKDTQDYLNGINVVGKVLSIAVIVRIAENLQGGELDAFELAIINKSVPEEIRKDFISPYLSDDANQARFSVRVVESDPLLNRKQLIDDINAHLVNKLGLHEEQVNITGMLVLYNNMLQSLFRSQILTLSVVLLAIFLTFILLFRSLVLAALGIVPNIFSAVMILGIMGWFRIPLDMMTITIASITIGIAVDDTIHYIHRLRHEYMLHNDYAAVIDRCHTSIGKAMFYTSVAIIFGFAILAFSNFIPTINFGIMTGIAMFMALAGNLLLLPALILIVKPVIKSSGRLTT